jgi:hypothetical protein
MHERRGALAHASFVALEPQPSRRRYRSSTVTVLELDPDAPAASVTVTRTVKLLGRRTTYVCPAVNDPSLDTVPLDVEPSPQSIVYVQGPLWLASVKLQLSEYSTPVTAVSFGPAFTTGGALQSTAYETVAVPPDGTVTVCDAPPLTVQFAGTVSATA